MPAPYVPMTAEERQRMLAAIGVDAVEDLFTDIPVPYRDPDLSLPSPLSEHDVLKHLIALSARNRPVDSGPSFLGGGFAHHFIPSVVGAIISRGEFLTPYTPYQPEASQGILQALFEYQTAVCQLTGMDVSNTGMYDGASALAEAALMACRLTGRRHVTVHESVSPIYRDALTTYLAAQEITLGDDPSNETACLLIQEPGFLGTWHEPEALAKRIHDLGGLLVVAVEPVSLALFRAPGDYGADIVVGEGQPLGISLSFGGPGVGLFASRQEFLRQMPGRIVGRTVDGNGRDAFVLTLQTREQHIRREKATSNICTAETLAAIAVAVHLAALGKQGFREVAEGCYHKAHYAAARIASLPGFDVVNRDAPFLKEFVVTSPVAPAAVNQHLLQQYGILGGIDVSDHVPNGLLLCVTETTSRAEIDALVDALSALSPSVQRPPDSPTDETLVTVDSSPSGDKQQHPSHQQPDEQRVPLLMDLSRPGRRGTSTPALDVPLVAELPPESVLRDDLQLPEVSELDLIRYFTRLSQTNYSVDTNFYPLGSCTMKYNPRVNEVAAGLPGFARIHPYQPQETVQGAFEMLHGLQAMLAEIVGMHATSLAPSAGAHGELSGMLLFRAYHRNKGDGERTVVLAPDSSHGTNPASAAMAGFKLVGIPTDPHGNVDMDALKEALSPHVAGIMLTMPTTLGLFDPQTAEICRLVHEAGGLVYGDGANLNALLGRARLGDLGFDIVHINVHKTFSTPHGGGGPGAGPICVKEFLAPFLPTPHIVKSSNDTYSLVTPPQSVGRIGSALGNVGVLLRAYTYIRMHGAEGLRDVSGAAVLNANYLRVKLSDSYRLPYDRPCMHEVVLSASRQKQQGAKAGEVCKRLLDYGFYAPTVYFPLIVDEALMIEPTETESPETLDTFIEAMQAIAREIEEQPDLVRSAPHTTPVARIDEARAARHPDLRWRAREPIHT